jgi:glyoxylase I family protein
VDVLGCEYMYSLGPYVHDDDWMTTHLVSYPDGKAFDRHAAR